MARHELRAERPPPGSRTGAGPGEGTADAPAGHRGPPLDPEGDKAEALIRRHAALRAERAAWEGSWQEIAELMRPMRDAFQGPAQPGAPRTARLFDGTAGLAADNLASGLWSMITNSANSWFALAHADPELNREPEVRGWLDAATERMREGFAGNGQRFYAQARELYADVVVFGTGVFYAEDAAADGRVYHSCRPLAECCVAESDRGVVDTVFRQFELTARQAAQRWGEAAGEDIERALDRGEGERRFPFLHAVFPRTDLDPRRRDARGKPWASQYLALESGRLVAEGGYMEFPFQVPRWATAPRGPYGVSQAMLALPDVKMLNQMSKTTIIGAQKAVDPPLLVPDEAALRGVRTQPGGLIYGGVDAQGRPLYQPLVTNGRPDLALQLEEQRREAVREAFHFSLLLMVQAPGLTATEVLARQEEKLRLMGPHLGRLQSEFLDPLIHRQFRVMRRAGAFPPIPPALAAMPELRVVYVSPLARAQRAAEGAAIMRTFEALAPLVAQRPELLDNFDLDEVARATAAAYGIPARTLRAPDAVAALRAPAPAEAMAAMPAPGPQGDPLTALAGLLPDMPALSGNGLPSISDTAQELAPPLPPSLAGGRS